MRQSKILDLSRPGDPQRIFVWPKFYLMVIPLSKLPATRMRTHLFLFRLTFYEDLEIRIGEQQVCTSHQKIGNKACTSKLLFVRNFGCLSDGLSCFLFIFSCTLQKTNIAMWSPPFEDVSPIEEWCVSIAMLVYQRVTCSKSWLFQGKIRENTEVWDTGFTFTGFTLLHIDSEKLTGWKSTWRKTWHFLVFWWLFGVMKWC